jgi:DNA modification methylase
MDYDTFIKNKVCLAQNAGFEVQDSEISTYLKPHQRDIVKWAIRGGQRAIFASFGLGKTLIQLEIMRLIAAHEKTNCLIVCPLGVRQEFKRDAKKIGVDIRFIRRASEMEDDCNIYMTNYETIRDHKMNPCIFGAASLDEASILRGFGGTKTFREFMATFAGDRKTLNTRDRSGGVKYRFVATATPSPNDYIELLAYAAYLDIMDVSQAKTRFFKRDSTKADCLTLHPHKEDEFWLWVASWGIFINKPSNLGHDDTGYDMPGMVVNWHKVESDHSQAGFDKYNQGKLFIDSSIGVQDQAKEKRLSLTKRIDKMKEIIGQSDDNFILWHDLEKEREAIEKALPDAKSVYGNLDLEEREARIIGFSDGEFKYLAAKPVIAGSGCNFQRHCHRAIFLGIGFKFNDFIQAIHRIYRFMQDKEVVIDIIYTEAESQVKSILQKKWNNHNIMVGKMQEIIETHGLAKSSLESAMRRAIGCDRVEVKGERFTAVHWDCVKETDRMTENSVDLILTSIPFSSQYEYSPNYADFGHSDNNEQFWKQMDYLIPKLLKILKPGRIAAIHVKDRIVPSGMTGLGYQIVYPLHAECINRFSGHGFGYMGMKTIVTDVVRENNQTYRLGWTEQCKDGSKMGVGMPEYLLLFRKTPTDTINAYADTPVVKSKEKYTRARWQTDAHGFARSSGNRLLTGDEVKDVSSKDVFRWFRGMTETSVYDYEYHVAIGEALDKAGRLPVSFMLLQPASWSDDVYSDITRMKTLNTAQYSKGRQMHLCPMQIDLADRVINQFSMKDEVVFDPFAGLMTVPFRAVSLGRVGYGCELSPSYFSDGLRYLHAAEMNLNAPTLFDMDETFETNMEGEATNEQQ